MVKTIVLGALVLALGVGVAFFYGCGPRAEVAANKVIAQLDKVLGNLEVKRTKIKQNREKIVKKLANSRDKRVGAEVRLELFEKKKAASEAKLEKTKQDLQKLKGIIEEAKASESGTVTRNGKDFTTEDIAASVVKLTQQYKLDEANVKNLQVSIDALSRSVTVLKTQEKSATDLMINLDNKIAEIDNKKIAVDAVRQASVLSGDDASISDDINALNKEIEDMFVEVESALRVEEEKINAMQAETDAVDELLAEPTDLGGLMDDIDALLGDSNGNGE